jgi:aminoglycoside phosphotransferase family enzyme/predicted kinase
MNELAESLRKPEAYPHATGPIEVAETHISLVFLTDKYAYKIKKPVRFPFVNFSTLEKRYRSCRDELRLNRRLAPNLYLDVVPIGGSPASPRVGAVPAIEYAVKMLRFDPSQTLDRYIDQHEISRRHIQELAELLATFHQGLAPLPGTRPGDDVRKNADELLQMDGPVTQARLRPVRDWLSAQSEALENLFAIRERSGAIRECHGDLHLGNLVLLDDRIVPFDCLEFDRSLRTIDVIDEMAFPVMDLLAHACQTLAFELLNRYLERTGDYTGTRLLRYYLLHRALIRCKTRMLNRAIREQQRDAIELTPYLDLAEQLISESAPRLMITHGFSGSGKTTVTNELLATLPAIRIRSDIERKRLHGIEPGEGKASKPDEALYSTSASDKTYATLERFAASALDAGFNVIIDAAFLKRARRDSFRRLARKHLAGFTILSFDAAVTELRERVSLRRAQGADASDADVSVLEQQLRTAEPLSPEESRMTIGIDTTSPVDTDSIRKQVALCSTPAS